MDTALDILSRARQYLDRQLSLHELENWVVHNLDELLSEPGTTPYELAGAIELGLAEISAGDVNEASFRSDIESLLADRTVIVRIGAVRELASATNSTSPDIGTCVRIGAIPAWSNASTQHATASL